MPLMHVLDLYNCDIKFVFYIHLLDFQLMIRKEEVPSTPIINRTTLWFIS